MVRRGREEAGRRGRKISGGTALHSQGCVPPRHLWRGGQGVGYCSAAALILTICLAGTVSAQDTTSISVANDSVVIRLVDTDLRSAIQALSRYVDKTVLTVNIPQVRVTLEPPGAVPRGSVAVLLRGLVESNGLQMIEDTAYYRIEPRPVAPDPVQVRTTDERKNEDLHLFVVRLKHARASDVAATVNLLFGGSGEFSGRGGSSAGTLSEELQRQNVPPQGIREVKPDGSSSPTGASLSGQVTIVPDELTNSILVRASQQDFDVMKQAVDQLDIRPLQVLIEVLIVEARSDRNFALGNTARLPPQSLGNGTADATLTSGGLGDLVIRLMGLGKADVDATLRLAASRGDVEIMSRPVLLASNNTQASFLVGSQRPFVQVSRSLPTDTPSRDQVVQYRDVGTKLTVLPTINQDGYVSLLIQQEINAATSETQFDAPIISTREARTQVLVRDGQTIVIGGLKDNQRDRSHSGIPVLSAIPILGGLFGSTSDRKTETELYIFITPRILTTDEDADRVTEPRLPAAERVHD
jgi:type II secretory pathway component GspD/PulD (secretin)